MTKITGPDCAIMCNLINICTHTHTRIRTDTHIVSSTSQTWFWVMGAGGCLRDSAGRLGRGGYMVG